MTKLASCFDRKGRKISALKHSNKHVHLYRDSTRKMIYNFSAPLVDICFDVNGDDISLLCLDTSGNIFKLAIPVFKKKKSTESRSHDTASGSKVNKLKFQSTSEPITMVTSQHILTTIPGIQAMMCVNTWLVTATKTETSWCISLYNLGSLSNILQSDASISIPLSSSANCDNKALVRYSTLGQEHHSNSDGINIDSLLHQQLFGTQESVILFSEGDGSVFYIPLPPPTSCFIESLQLKILYQGPYQICGLHSAIVLTTKNKSSEEDKCSTVDSPCFLIVSHTGHLVLITAEDEPITFHQLCVTGPVVCSHVSGSSLYHSTGTGLFSTQLTIERKGSHCMPKCFKVSNVQALTCLKDKSKDSPPPLIAVLKSGRVMTISPDQQKQDNHVYLANSDRLKDLMSSIKSVHNQLETASELSQQYSDILCQLNLASHVVSEKKPEKSLMKFESAIKIQDLGTCFELILECKVTNSSTIALGDGWALSLVLELGCHGDQEAVCKSCNLHTLQPNQFQQINTPITPEMLRNLPITIKPVLVYSYRLDSKDGACVEVPLISSTVDYLDVLRPSSVGSHRMKDLGSDVASLINGIGQRKRHVLGFDVQATSEEDISASVIVPKLPSKKRKADEVSFIQTLLRGSLIKPSSEQDFIKAITPCGHQVSLAVHTTEDHTEVKVHTLSPSIMWHVITSVHSRIQKMMGKSKKPPLLTKELRKYLAHAEDIKKELDSIEETNSTTPDVALGLYWQLRKHVLP